jgi:hypothetical protein
MGCVGLLGWQVVAYAQRRATQLPPAEQERQAKRINAQLDEILAIQETILKRYDELMEVLRIIKVRASQ